MTREEQIEKQAQIDECCYISNNYDAFKRGVEWADKHPKNLNEGIVSLDEICIWLNDNNKYYTTCGYEMIKDLRKAMEG